MSQPVEIFTRTTLSPTTAIPPPHSQPLAHDHGLTTFSFDNFQEEQQAMPHEIKAPEVADNVFMFTGTEVNWVIIRDGTELTLVDAGWEGDVQEVERSIRFLAGDPRTCVPCFSPTPTPTTPAR